MRNILGLFFICMLLACGQKQEVIPSDILSEEKMVGILMDIHIAEAGVKAEYKMSVDSMNQLAVNYYGFIFEKHKVSKEEFKRSYEYYLTHPKLLTNIYLRMTEEMSKKEAEMTKP